jgi:hypothetical protein
VAIIAVIQQKGGVGKSTITANLAGELVEKKLIVRVLDLDPQQSVATWARLGGGVLSEIVGPVNVENPRDLSASLLHPSGITGVQAGLRRAIPDAIPFRSVFGEWAGGGARLRCVAWQEGAGVAAAELYNALYRKTSPMKRKAAFLAITLLGAGLVTTGQQPDRPAIFTAAQAEAGRRAYDNSCGKCHTYTLLGRKGEDGELPPVASLSAPYQKFIGTPNHVPPLAGKVFLSRWGQKTAAELIARFQVTASDPFFQFEGMNEETTVNITAYVLQTNGAKPGSQPLTRTTSVVVQSTVP